MNWPVWLGGPESFITGLLIGGNLIAMLFIARLERK